MATQIPAEQPKAKLTRKQRENMRKANLRRMGQLNDEASVGVHVNPQARAHGDYAMTTLPGPPVIEQGEERVTTIRVARNRGGTAIDRWTARGDLDGDKLNAVQAYQCAWHHFIGLPRVTTNWSMVGGGSCGAGDGEERGVITKLQAKELLSFLDDEVFFGKPLGYFDLWQNVVIHDEPAGVAGSRLGFRNDGAEAAAKAIVLMLAGEIAIALHARRRRQPKPG